MVKWTRSTELSDFSRLRQVRSPGMRLARDQQHPQPVAHAVDLHHRAVVAVGQFALRLGHDELQHVHAAVRQRHRQIDLLADRHLELLRLAAVDRRSRAAPALPAPAGPRPGPRPGGVRFTGSPMIAKAGAVSIDQPPVPVGLLAGQQHVERRRQVGRPLDIVQPPVGDQDRAGDPARGSSASASDRRGHQQRASVALAVAHAHHPQLGVLAAPPPRPRARPARPRSDPAGRRCSGWRCRRPPAITMSDRGARSSGCSDGFAIAASSAAAASARSHQPESRRHSASATTSSASAPAPQTGHGRSGSKTTDPVIARTAGPVHSRRCPLALQISPPEASGGSKCRVLPQLIGRASRAARARGPGRTCSCRSAHA